MLEVRAGLLATILLACASPQSTPPAPARPKPSSDPQEKPTESEPRPNLVLVTLDTTRADRLGCYGYSRPTTPSIDALAAESQLFERCICAVPHTTPSHCSILTGVYPLEHGITSCSFRASKEKQESLAFAPTPQLQTYPQILASHGWHTGGFVSASPVRRITGLAAGFETWSEPAADDEYRAGAKTMADALAWLKDAPEPFFLWVHLFDAHAPPRSGDGPYGKQLASDEKLLAYLAELHIAPTIHEERSPREEGGARGGGGAVSTVRINAVYDSCIRLVDDYVKELRDELEKRGAWPRTTFVLTGDHGEGMGQHDFVTHALCWNEQVQVPFLIRVPGLAPNRFQHVVSSIDVLPTAVALTPGLPKEELLEQARGRNAAAPDFEERPVFSMSPPFAHEFALTTSRWKYIHREEGEDSLYDLEKDPHELKDVKSEQPKAAAAMKAQLDASMREQKERRRYYKKGAVVPKISPEEERRQREQLERLGYTDDSEKEGAKKPAGGEGGHAEGGNDHGEGGHPEGGHDHAEGGKHDGHAN